MTAARKETRLARAMGTRTPRDFLPAGDSSQRPYRLEPAMARRFAAKESREDARRPRQSGRKPLLFALLALNHRHGHRPQSGARGMGRAPSQR